MKKSGMILLFLLLVPIVCAQWYYDSEEVNVKIDMNTEAIIIEESSNAYVKQIRANLSFFPKDYENQEVIKSTIVPEYSKKGDHLIFVWDEPTNKVRINADYDIKIANEIKGVKSKVRFPLETIPEEVMRYIKAAETIDSNDENIIKLANELAKGETDLFVVVGRIAEWTNGNIKYDLSTLTEGVSQKASWVLENREGVCDELTSLFIAMNRALGIPAKFVSGIAFTNSDLFDEEWGPHGWAEVYFPGYGWIAYDVTYGEYGFVNPTHIKLKESYDAAESTIGFNWVGRNVDLKTTNLNIKTDLIGSSGKAENDVSIKVNMERDAIKIGSYNIVKATIKNLKPYYLALELILSKPKEIYNIDDESKFTILKPNEEKKVYWIVKVDDNLDKGYIYTSPITVYTVKNISATSKFSSSKEGIFLSLDQAKDIVNENSKNEKIINNEIDIYCNSEKYEYLLDEQVDINCNVKNIGNNPLDSLRICFEDVCEQIDLGSSQGKDIDFIKVVEKLGEKEIEITASNKVINEKSVFEVVVTDKPSIEILNIKYPDKIGYGENYEIKFSVKKNSESEPKNIVVIFSEKDLEKRWELDELVERDFIIKLDSSDLSVKDNNIKIEVKYSDKKGNSYAIDEKFSIELIDLTFGEKVIIGLKDFGRWTERQIMKIKN